MKKLIACTVDGSGILFNSAPVNHDRIPSQSVLRWAVMVAIVILVILPATARSQLTINLDDGGGAAPGTAAGDAFRAAADTWEATLFDNVTLTIEVRFGSIGPSGEPFPTGVRGASSQSLWAIAYDDSVFNGGNLIFLDAIAADALSVTDTSVVSTLPSLLSTLACCTGTKIIPMRRNVENGGAAYLLDPDAANIGDGAESINNFNIVITQANAKALGITEDVGGSPINAAVDGVVALNSFFSWDFDPSDGLTGSDFFGTALHEIGHVLGFISGVVVVGCAADPLCSLGGIAIDDGFHVTSLDLLRYSSASVGLGAIDSAVGGTPYFSTDGGVTSLGGFSSGTVFGGDGNQPDHWIDVPFGVPLGVMNPTSADPLQMTNLDMTAFDGIGWDLAATPPGPDPGDADGDGVDDGADLCMNTAANDLVDVFGCSQVQVDSDGDGVCNTDAPAGAIGPPPGCIGSDACSDTPQGETVNAEGCSDTQLDTDNDGVTDAEDNCPLVSNAGQEDLDDDDVGDVCDDDIDGDNILNDGDNCPINANEDQADNDSDTIGDVCDPDDDNDNVLDGDDNCPINANEDQADNDLDSIGDVCDPDDDNDSVDDDFPDNCPFDANPNQEDADNDGLGDVCEPDDDNDGVADGSDVCPSTGIPEGVPTSSRGLGKNRWTLDNLDGSFTQGPPQAGRTLSFSTTDTAGCSCEQIIAKLSLGKSHTKYGCSNSAMIDWANMQQ